MTFANVSVNPEQLTFLSRLLVTAFPGCTIHQSRDPMRAMRHLSTEKVDAIFADTDTYSDLIDLLREHPSKTSVYLLCRQDSPPPEKTEHIRQIVTYPITKQKIQFALQTVPQEIREVV